MVPPLPRWEEKIPLAKTTLEKTWLFHEIGRCYLELDQPWQAQNYGEKSQQCAEEEGDMEWQLNASVLVAQAQGRDAETTSLRSPGVQLPALGEPGVRSERSHSILLGTWGAPCSPVGDVEHHGSYWP